jgi:hypothetical protein
VSSVARRVDISSSITTPVFKTPGAHDECG